MCRNMPKVAFAQTSRLKYSSSLDPSPSSSHVPPTSPLWDTPTFLTDRYLCRTCNIYDVFVTREEIYPSSVTALSNDQQKSLTYGKDDTYFLVTSRVFTFVFYGHVFRAYISDVNYFAFHKKFRNGRPTYTVCVSLQHVSRI